MSYLHVAETKEQATIIMLNRPKVYNALNRGLLFELRSVLDTISKCTRTRVVIVTGGEVFCSGADLKERVAFTEEDVREYIQLIRDTFIQIDQLPQPVIAAISGYCFGGGMEMALACDLRVAGENTKFGLVETSLGIIPGAGGTQRLPRLIGESKAKELIFLARKFKAIEAERIGVVNKVVDDSRVMEAALEFSKEIARNGPLAIRQAKKSIHHSRETGLMEGLQMETNEYDPLIATKDRLEGLAAFKEKRVPEFTGN